MADQALVAVSFVAFLLLFTAVGLYSANWKSNTTADYLLASRSVNPWLTGLSTFGTSHGGGMFVSTLGFTYVAGISSIWLLVGWFLGDYFSWFFVHKRLRQLSEATGAETIGAFLSGYQAVTPASSQIQPLKRAEERSDNLADSRLDNNRSDNIANSLSDNVNESNESNEASIPGIPTNDRIISVTSALITIAFLGAYAAAQLLAGSKALNVIFGWNYSVGIILACVLVVVYCFSGGIRASIWTDAIQSILMMVAMFLLVFLALRACGGLSGLWTQLEAIDPALINLVPEGLQFGFPLFLLSWLAGGVGAVGQPHIMVRAMVLDSAENMGLTRNIYAIFYVIFSTGSVLAGLTARVLVPGLINGGDPETAFPILATQMLPALLIGMTLAGIFSAVISTADSQILSCSAALTQDLFPKVSKSYTFVKIGTLTVTAIVLTIALSSNKNMFALGVFAWSALSCGLGPLLVLRTWQLPVSSPVAVTMMVVGVGVAAMWNAGLKFSGSIYEVLPGMFAGVLVYGVARVMGYAHDRLG